MPATYDPIATNTLSSSAASITLSSIPATYTDLRLILIATATNAASDYNLFTCFNSDAGANYSLTQMGGNGTTAVFGKIGTTSSINLIGSQVGFKSSAQSLYSIDIFSYSGSTNKTCLFTASQDFNGTGSVVRGVGLWRNTGAITSLTFTTDGSNNFATGTTATIYGIKNA